MSILTNHMPIQCQSHAIQGHSLDQSRINLIQFCQSSTNPVPIPCHFWIQHQFSNFQNLSISANPSRSMPIHCQFFLATQVLNSAEFARFEPIQANSSQSMSILDNQVPIPGQSVTSYVVNHRASPLYGMVSSPLGGTKLGHLVATQCKLDTNPAPLLGTIQNQSDPFFAIQYQSGANLMLVQRQPFDPILTLQFRKMVNQSQSQQIQCQSQPIQCQFYAITESHSRNPLPI